MNRKKSFENENEGRLYLVATPIGNVQELSPRAIEILNSADMIACEDTRTSGILLSRFGIKRPMMANHDHNEEQAAARILQMLEEGKQVAVISDAGYPLISDPGSKLVAQAAEKGFAISTISGPNAGINALVASGLPGAHFLFYGFLNAKSSRRKTELGALKDFPWTMIFYEAPHRIFETLKDMEEVFGNRKAVVARELTKLHEEYLRGTLSELAAIDSPLKGEMVIIVEGAPEPDENDQFEKACQKVKEAIESGTKAKAACKEAAAQFKVSKNELYDWLLSEKNKTEDE